jgi:ParB family chromosome partitioning protein
VSLNKKEQPYTSTLKGVAALLGEPAAAPTQSVTLEAIYLPSGQPRRYFDPDKLEQLALSIKQHGILEPLLVRPLQQENYELVAGERRYRAAKIAGLEEVPVVVRDLSDEEALQLALVENLQREDLNPIEETEGILQLLAFKLGCAVSEIPPLLYQMKNALDRNSEVRNNVVPHPESGEQQQVQAVFQGLGLMSWLSFTTHRLPLLNLPKEILEALRQGKIAYTKAIAIARVKDELARKSLLTEVIEQGLSLAQIRERVASIAAIKQVGKQPLPLEERTRNVVRRFQKAKIWQDPKKQKKLEKLLAQMESLLTEE